MYVVTFYSFKGGVGRSLALVNVGVELALRGKRVLLVDFDLEAPGLTTFDLPIEAPDGPGVVDYILEYNETGLPPRLDRFICDVTPVDNASQEKGSRRHRGGGRLWIMPAGQNDAGYGDRFRRIDWEKLYTEHDGFLLMENLRAQWQEHLEPDYVLIDSRTGHTDTGGICTRQLPDAVALFFFPTRQNLAGLKEVVAQIRQNKISGRVADLHFVMSNVPELDDEEGILHDIAQDFRRTLNLKRRPLTINRYHSLDLLNQVVFTLHRKKTRLAQQYRKLTDQMSRLNLNDRDGALLYLGKDPHQKPFLNFGRTADIEEGKLHEIEERFADDGEVLAAVASHHQNLGAAERAARIYQRSIDLGWKEASAYMGLSTSLALSGRKGEAAEAFWNLLVLPEASYGDRSFALKMIEDVGGRDVLGSVSGESVVGLDVSARVQIAEWYRDNSGDRDLVGKFIKGAEHDDSLTDVTRNAVSLISIWLGEFASAMTAIESVGGPRESWPIDLRFNHAMATWGRESSAPVADFENVLRLGLKESPDRQVDANFRFCLAISAAAAGQDDVAERFLDKARKLDMEGQAPLFSPWTYEHVDPEVFQSHIDEAKEALGGELLPPVLLARVGP